MSRGHRRHRIGHSFGGHHHHHHHCRNRKYPGLKTDPNWEKKEPAANGKWQGEFLGDCCYSPSDWIRTCYCPCLFNLMLANDICKIILFKLKIDLKFKFYTI